MCTSRDYDVALCWHRTAWRRYTAPPEVDMTRSLTSCWTAKLQSWPRRRTAWVLFTWPYKEITPTAPGYCSYVTPILMTSPLYVFLFTWLFLLPLFPSFLFPPVPPHKSPAKHILVLLHIFAGWLGGVTVRASDLRSSGRGFDSRSGRYQAT